ncbi:tubulin binding cofactor C-domain-containing protein [Parachaetomium inaequale]|uniref:Tubulin binding cofactor C-domain-containing protein n=1 Tax=Parachaetomium inaequale TaxID=2588326 RepID=A0AAN6PC89_9PEZI|nr:tubulin binding cofactor C-domain-containing protein [Parachaetomium inaequale]
MGTMDPKERFYRQFQNSATTIQEQINQLSHTAAVPGERQDAVEHILSGISHLSSDVADATDFITAHDQRTYSDIVKSLKDQVNAAAAKWAPKSRFQFKKRAEKGGGGGGDAATAKPDTRRLDLAANNNNNNNPTDLASKPTTMEAKDITASGALPTVANTSTTANPAADGNVDSTGNPYFSSTRNITLADHNHVHITLPASSALAVSVGTLTNLERCVVDMTIPTTKTADADDEDMGCAPFASLTLKEIQGSVIVAGHVAGPVHVTGVRDSVVMVMARQVRIHECKNVVFYLHCVSRPIVEDCKGVRFAKAPGAFLTDKEKSEANLYDQVDDFKWLKTFSSPNWSLLPEAEVVPEAVWLKALAPGPGMAIGDTLRNLGAGKRAETES